MVDCAVVTSDRIVDLFKLVISLIGWHGLYPAYGIAHDTVPLPYLTTQRIISLVPNCTVMAAVR